MWIPPGRTRVPIETPSRRPERATPARARGAGTCTALLLLAASACHGDAPRVRDPVAAPVPTDTPRPPGGSMTTDARLDAVAASPAAALGVDLHFTDTSAT